MSSVLIFFGVLSVAFSLTAFVALPWWLASLALLYALAQFVSYVGLRRMRRWAVYLFFGCLALWLGPLFLVGFEELVASSRLVVFALLPIVLFILAWFPNRALFS